MKNLLGVTGALAALVIFLPSAQADIKIEVAVIKNGAVHVEGAKAQIRAAVSWEGVALGITSNNHGEFKFDTTDLPPDCVGRLKIGTEERDVVIKQCMPTLIQIIEAGVPQTGALSSFAVGDDADLKKGVPWPNPRFTDNGTGTVTDNLTQLIWLKNANCFGARQWSQAVLDANGLADGACGLTDGSVAGNWRLPNIKELLSLVGYHYLNPALPNGHPFTGFQSTLYWSSTTYSDDSSTAWFVNFVNGFVNFDGKINFRLFIPVSGGL